MTHEGSAGGRPDRERPPFDAFHLLREAEGPCPLPVVAQLLIGLRHAPRMGVYVCWTWHWRPHGQVGNTAAFACQCH